MSDSKVENNTETKPETKNEAKDENKTELKGDLDVVIAKTIECQCGESNLAEDELYYCNHDNCKGKIYCDECIDFEHKFSKKKNKYKKGHKLNRNELTSVNDLFDNPKHDKPRIKYGKRELVKLYGQELYNTIMPYVEGGTILAYSGAIAGTLIVETSATLSASAYTGAHLTSHIVGVGLGVAAGAFAIELIVNGKLWLNEEISGKELLKRTGKSFIRSGAMCAGLFSVKGSAILGSKIGGAIGTAAGPAGTVIGAAVGTFIGVLISLGASWYLAKKLNKKIDDNFVFDDEMKRKQALKEALIYFHFSQDAVDDPKKFNAKILHKKYKVFAFDCHPDRPNGDTEAFIKLNTFYGILLALCEDVPQNRKKTILKNIPKSLTFAAQ